MEFEKIRLTVITALFTDDMLMELLVLKGGNALNLVHKIGSRASVDLDFTVQGDFADMQDAERRMIRCLEDRFEEHGLAVFEASLARVPDAPPESDPWPEWGGYRLTFKLIETNHVKGDQDDPGKRQRESLVTGPEQKRVFRVDFSKYEGSPDAQLAEIDDYRIVVYSPAMIAAEKLRAICQQMKEYDRRGHPAPRPADFYDVSTIVDAGVVALTSSEFLEILRTCFDAKTVPIALLGKVREYREFHREAWQKARESIVGESEEFDVYFDYVCRLCDEVLEALGVI